MSFKATLLKRKARPVAPVNLDKLGSVRKWADISRHNLNTSPCRDELVPIGEDSLAGGAGEEPEAADVLDEDAAHADTEALEADTEAPDANTEALEAKTEAPDADTEALDADTEDPTEMLAE